MLLSTRNLLDRSFTAICVFSILLMGIALIILLGPIFYKGIDAFYFKGTVEFRRVSYDKFERGDKELIIKELVAAQKSRKPLFDIIFDYEKDVSVEVDKAVTFFANGKEGSSDLSEDEINALQIKLSSAFDDFEEDLQSQITDKSNMIKEAPSETAMLLKEDKAFLEETYRQLKDNRKVIIENGRSAVIESMEMMAGIKFDGQLASVEEVLRRPLSEFYDFKSSVRQLFGHLPGDADPVMPREEYGQTRWDRALVKLHEVNYITTYVKEKGSEQLILKEVSRHKQFVGTSLEPAFDLLNEKNVSHMLRPKTTFYYQFLLDRSYDSNLFGGIWPEMLGTLALTFGSMLIAVPFGVVAAIYLTEYAKETWLLGLLRSCITTLAGVPSIVFGLFGLALLVGKSSFLNVTDSRSVLAGSITLALLILPTIIRSSEEAIRAVPRAYVEAAMGLGASRWHTVITVIIPAALPGILTGIVISMGRAAGETAPIIFTAATSLGDALSFSTKAITSPTPALSWNIYNLCSENEVAQEIVHVQYGMVLTLVGLVLVLNASAIVMRARITKKLRG